MVSKPKKSKKKKLPSAATTKKVDHVPITDDELRPDQLEDLLELGSEPHKALITAAKQCGLDEKATKRMLDSIKRQYQPVLGELRKVKTSEISKLIDDRVFKAMTKLDDNKLDASSAKDLAIIVGILLEKRALLRGEPTQIFSIEDRNNMNELLPKLLQEASKRGMFVDVIDGMVDVTPGDYEREHRPRARMSLKTHRDKAAQKRKDEIGDPS